MQIQLEKALEHEVRAFVENLNGRYKNHCSDDFLTALILRQLDCEYRNRGLLYIELMLRGNMNAAYDAVCWIFESILEHRCKAGGNGHHVAQNFAKTMEEFFKKRKT